MDDKTPKRSDHTVEQKMKLTSEEQDPCHNNKIYIILSSFIQYKKIHS